MLYVNCILIKMEKKATLRFWSLCSNLGSVIVGEGDGTHSSTLAWKIPWTEEPGGLQSMGSLRVRHHWVTSLSLFTFMHWRRKWQPIPVFLPGESQGRGRLVVCCLWGRTELDTTEETEQQQQQQQLSFFTNVTWGKSHWDYFPISKMEENMSVC